jgi:hypothetical protein
MAASIFDAAAAPAADLPKPGNFMRSQNGPAKAKLLNMHTKALIRPFEKRTRKKPAAGVKRRFARPPVRSINRRQTPPSRRLAPDHRL